MRLLRRRGLEADTIEAIGDFLLKEKEESGKWKQEDGEWKLKEKEENEKWRQEDGEWKAGVDEWRAGFDKWRARVDDKLDVLVDSERLEA